jgi:hypothetical protein
LKALKGFAIMKPSNSKKFSQVKKCPEVASPKDLKTCATIAGIHGIPEVIQYPISVPAAAVHARV